MSAFIWTVVVLFCVAMLINLNSLRKGQERRSDMSGLAIAVVMEVVLISWGLVLVL